MTLFKMQSKLRKANKKNYVLYLFCNFVAMMLITAYAAMMLSPTVLSVLPEGGDSRKQMVMIFALACIGCTVFTIYGTSLFFRIKAKEIGLLMALGAGPQRLAKMVLSEVALISSVSALAGTICGMPFAWILWQLFRTFIVDTDQMVLRFNFGSLLISLAFIIFIVMAAFLMGLRYLKKTNIMDVLHEEHKNEPVRELGRYCGPVGIVLLLVGAVCGYASGGVYMKLFSAYPPVWLNVLYAPVFIGLYMILLHTVVHGWKKKRNVYKGIISRSMMKFQGKQTVNNMMVVSVLVAGAIFGLFYIPVSVSTAMVQNSRSAYAYMYQYPGDVEGLNANQVEQLAGKYDLSLDQWTEVEYLTLGLDGMMQVEEGRSFHDEYQELLQEGTFLSETAYNQITGQGISVADGSYYAVDNQDESAGLYYSQDAEKITNMVTREVLATSLGEILHYDLFVNQTGGTYVLSDNDYQQISDGITDEWKGSMALFNVKGEDSYEFAQALFYTFANSFDDQYEVISSYDRVSKIAAEEKGEVYWGDTDRISGISYDNPDDSDFRGYWKYMPKFQILDQNDLLRNMAVFFMMFLFIAIICIVAAMIICYTRCMTIATNNGYVFKDLRRLGGSTAFLRKEIRSQAVKVYAVPYITGAVMMSILYSLIMFGNDGRISSDEVVGLLAGYGIVLVVTVIVYLLYRMTTRKMENMLIKE